MLFKLLINTVGITYKNVNSFMIKMIRYWNKVYLLIQFSQLN